MSAAGDGLNPEKNVLQLNWDEEDIDDVNTMKAFLRDHGPDGTPFLFTPQGETEELYRCKAFDFQWSGPDSGTFSASFERWYGSTP
jgi:phage-related protein